MLIILCSIKLFLLLVPKCGGLMSSCSPVLCLDSISLWVLLTESLAGCYEDCKPRDPRPSAVRFLSVEVLGKRTHLSKFCFYWVQENELPHLLRTPQQLNNSYISRARGMVYWARVPVLHLSEAHYTHNRGNLLNKKQWRCCKYSY